MTSMEVDGDGASAARRRRERRLRSWWRHGCLSVRMALTTAAHHSAEKVAADVKDAGLRAQTMVSAGQRPGALTEPEPQGAVTVGYVAAPGPLLEVSSMAGGDSVDGTALRFLVKKALERQKEEEEEKRKEEEMLDILRRFRADLPVSDAEWEAWQAWGGIGSSASGQKRKRKKRRKKKTPRTSSHLSLPSRCRKPWRFRS